MLKKQRHLGEILYRKGHVSKDNLIRALKKSKTTNKRLGETLLEMGLATEDQVTEALAKQFNLEYVDLDNIEIPSNASKLIPEELVKKHRVIPLGQDNGELKVAIKDPMDLDLLDLLRFRLNTELRCCLASPTKIETFINGKMDAVRSSIDATAAELAAAGHTIEAEVRRAQATDEDDEGPIIRLVNLIIDEAVRMRASDIHIEPMADRVRVRYRVDGVCVERDNIPKTMQAPILARV